MPLYEYRCDGCRASFEILQQVGAGADGLECPECGGADLTRQHSTFAASTARGASAGDRGAPGCGSGFT